MVPSRAWSPIYISSRANPCLWAFPSCIWRTTGQRRCDAPIPAGLCQSFSFIRFLSFMSCFQYFCVFLELSRDFQFHQAHACLTCAEHKFLFLFHLSNFTKHKLLAPVLTNTSSFQVYAVTLRRLSEPRRTTEGMSTKTADHKFAHVRFSSRKPDYPWTSAVYFRYLVRLAILILPQWRILRLNSLKYIYISLSGNIFIYISPTRAVRG